MLFNSLEFLILFLITAGIYYFPKCRSIQVWILLVSSFIFYAHHNPILLALLIFSIGCNTAGSYAVLARNDLSKAKWITLLTVTLNLVVLGWFKYAGLLANTIWGTSGEGQIWDFMINIPLPLGISFFTFQGISLVMDCFHAKRGDSHDKKVEVLFEISKAGFIRYSLNTAFYISFFPQLVAGPIVKAKDFYFQIEPKLPGQIQWEKIFRYVVLGYFLKMVIADNLKDLTYYLYYPLFLNIEWVTLISLLFGYSIQIFADFAGYSSIAIGLSAFFGYNIPINFRFPYCAQSFSDFWRRWHISLSSWLKEYLYFSLGGSQHGRARTYFNLFLVMFLGGLWHGASWNYAFWGIFHGLALAIERMFFGSKLSDSKNVLLAIGRAVFVFLYITHAWIFFILNDFDEYTAFLKAITNNGGLPNLVWITFVGLFSLPVILYHVGHSIQSRIQKYQNVVEPIAYGLMLWLIIFNAGSAGEFIYFQF